MSTKEKSALCEEQGCQLKRHLQWNAKKMDAPSTLYALYVKQGCAQHENLHRVQKKWKGHSFFQHCIVISRLLAVP